MKAIPGDKALSLFTSVTLTLIMALPLLFFVVLRFEGMQMTGGAIAAGWFLFLFFMILKTGDISRWRRVFFVSVALFFFPAFIARLFETRGHMELTAADVIASETPFCHIVIPSALIPMALTKNIIFSGRLTGHYAAIYSMMLIWLTASLTLGRGWCSWVCFYGGWDDGFSRLAAKTRLPLNPSNKTLRLFPFAMLGFVVLGSLVTMTSIYCDWFCSFKLITEYEAVTSSRSFTAFILMILLFFGLLIVLPLLTRRRFQCGVFCPFGAFQSLVGKVTAPYAVRLDKEKCIGCQKCVAACPTLSITRESLADGTGPLATCTLCGECLKACPKGALDYRFKNRKKTVCDPATGNLSGWKKILLGEILHPRTLFIFTAFLFGAIVSGGFASGTLGRLLNLFIKGSFTLGGH
jgi:polyferredoxin